MDRNAKGWLPLALHPHQAQRLIPHQFASDIAAVDLLLLHGVSMEATQPGKVQTL